MSKTLAYSQVGVVNVDDGNGIQSSIIEYSVYSSGDTPPGNPLLDGDGNPITSNNGLVLTDGSWSTTIPTVPNGQYLWTRTRFVLSDGTFDMIYNVSRSGEKGSTGAQGVSVVNVIPEYRLSDSSSELTGSGAGYSWSETKPKVESGQYIWERQRNELSNNTVVYSDAVCDVTMSGVVFDVDQNKQAISSKVWQSDLTTAINQYDSTKAQSIRDRVTATEQDINGITSTVSDVQSTLSTKADGSALTTLQNTVSQNEQTASQFRQTVQSTYARLTDVDSKISDIKISGHNLYIMKNDVPGYINSSGGTIATQSSTYKERTSEYIPVKEGETYVVQSWVTPNTTGQSWLAYQFYTDNTGTPSGSRVAKYGSTSGSGVETTADGQEHLTYKFTIPSGVNYLRVSYRQFEDGYAMIEKANTASEYAMNPEDLEKYTDDQVQSVRTFAEQTADKFTWLVESGDSSSNFTLTDRTAQLVANYINLNGTVTFSAFDADTQNALTSGAELIVGTQTASTSAWTGKSTKLKSLASGTRISYKLPYASTSTAVTLNLTLNNNTTTGAKNVYYLNDTRLTTQYGVNSIVELIYDGSAWRVINPYSDQNTYDRTRYQQAIKAGSTAIVAGNIIVAGANNVGTYTHLKLGNAFDTTYPILYAGSAISANSTGTNNYLIVPIGITTTQSGTYTAYKSVYIRGTLSGTTFTPVSTTPLTQTIPTSADNYHYMLLGTMYSTTEMYLLGEHPIFQYYNGGFKTTTQIAAEAAATATSANATANTASQNASDALSAVNASIKSTTMHYLATTAASGVTRSTSGWTTTIQSITASKRYLWTYQTITKVDNTTTDTDPVISGVWGNTGTSVTVSSNVTTYQAGTSGTTAPTGTWQSTVPTVADGQFLWTKVVTTFSDNTTATSYSVAKQGIQGTSVTVSSTSTTYQSGTSGTTAPTGAWETTIPTVAQGNYLWTKTVVTYSDGKSTTSYAVSYQSEDGDTGVSVTKVEQLYRTGSSTTAPAAPTSVITSTSTTYNTWTLAMPTYNTSYPYYYTCTQTTYSDGSHTWTTVARSKAIEDANTTANTANSNASAAVQTANTANTNASVAVGTANEAKSTADAANEKAAVGLGMKVNYSAFSTVDSGECYLHGYTDGVAADVDGYVYWNGIKRTVPKKMFNPNDVLPYLQTIYIVLRLSSATATTGTLYMVYYNNGWKYAVTPTPTASTTGDWTWTENIDIILGQFVEPSNEGQIVDAYLYDPPRNASHVITTGQNPYKYSQAAVSWVNTNGSSVVTAKDIINNWATDATNTMTTIDGGLIETHTILSRHLATDAIMSNNYIEGPTNSPYSSAGTFLDLSDGNIYMPNFGVNAITGAAYFNGTITAVDGMIGSDNTNYWQLGTITDYNGNDSAALVGHGTSYIQSGKWMISEDRIDTRWYDANRKYMYILNGTTYWDYGMQVPDPTSNLEYEKNFLYIRKHANTIPTLESDWDYPFRVTSDGKVYATDIIITGGGSGSTYLPLAGGTITGNLTVNGTLTATASQANKVTHSLSVNGKSFDGSANVTVGTIGTAYGGTGQTSLINSANALLNALTTGSSTPTDADYYISQYVGGGSTTTTYHRRPMSALWTYIKGKIDSVYNISGNYRTLDNNDFDTANITDANVGNLVVTGAGRFTNGLYGDLTGNVTGIATYATKVKDIGSNADTTFAYSKAGLAANWTTTPWFAAWNGYELRAIGVANMKTTLGLNNVDNTADANKSVAYATSAGSATTATSATSATTATTATYSYYPKIVASNEIRFDVSTKPSTATNLHIGYKWSDGSSDAKITRYIFDNGNAAQAEVQASTFYGALSGNASTATTAGSLTTGRDFTIGKTKKTAVKWDGAVAFTQDEISDCATNTANGWMSKEDKAKLDQITVSDIGRVSADTIVGATNGGINVSVTSGVATIKHTNQLSAGGTAQGTANNTTLTNGGSFTVPTITYDINGHITTTGTNKLTLPSITSVTGNAGTATKFASAQSVTLTGDTTGSASSQAGWSITTKTDRISTVADNRSVATTPNDYSNKIIFQGLKAKATIGNPSTDTYSYLVGLRGWSDSSGGNSHELAFNNSGIYRRTGATTDWGSWYLMLDTGNFNSYAPTLTGTGASGTWGISISGNATTATTASKLSGFTNTTSSATAIDNAITNGVYYVNGTSGIYSVSDGAAFVQGYSSSWVAQIYQDYRTGQIAVRGKNNGTWQAWRKILDSTSYSDYTVPKAGGAFTGAVTGTSFAVSSYLAANSGNSGTAGGLALYGASPTNYGIAMRQTSNGGKHGHVQGDWATYFYMTGSDSANKLTRGWIFKNATDNKGVVSISGAGNAAFDGEVSIGTTGTTTDGSCSLVVDHDMDCLNFVWN